MTVQRPFRFGVQGFPTETAREWTDLARKVEALGYDSFSVADHIGGRFAWGPALMAAAAVTTNLKIGSLVLDNDFRNPTLTVSEATTLDVLSDGRLEFGLGAGWMLEDYTRSGIPFDPPGVRVDRMAESLGIIKRAWSGETVNHTGTYYNLEDFTLGLLPVQKPHPPILIGAGSKRLLTLAAKEADIVGIAPPARPGGGIELDVGEATVKRQCDLVREQAGDRYDQIELQMLNQYCAVTDDRATAVASKAAEWDVPEEVIDGSLHVLIGSVDSIVDQLIERREEFGFSYVVVRPPVMEAFAPVVARLNGK